MVDKFKNNKTIFILIGLIILISLLSILVPMLSRYSYSDNNLSETYLNPSIVHLFGTDNLGRDLFTRTFYGARYSLIVAFVAGIINLFIGVLYGGIAGFFGGIIDNIMMRIVDVISSIPFLIYSIIFMVLFNQTQNNIIVIVLSLSVSYWIIIARIVRGDVLKLKQEEFIKVAKSYGVNNINILIKYLIPNCVPSILVALTLLIPDLIFTEAFLSFLGLGISAPRASLGVLINEAMQGIYTYPLQVLFPSIMLCIIILIFNLLGDKLTLVLNNKER
jgi:oligopeptide transport system permease protein